MALFRVNGLIQPKAYRSDTVRKVFGMAMSSQRARVMTLYRTLLHLGREYPQVRPGLENLAQLPDLCSGLHIFPGSLPRSISKEQRPSSQTGSFSINASTGETGSYHHQTLTLFFLFVKNYAASSKTGAARHQSQKCIRDSLTQSSF